MTTPVFELLYSFLELAPMPNASISTCIVSNSAFSVARTLHCERSTPSGERLHAARRANE